MRTHTHTYIQTVSRYRFHDRWRPEMRHLGIHCTKMSSEKRRERELKPARVEDRDTPLVFQYLSSLRTVLCKLQNQWPPVLEGIMVGNFRTYSGTPHEEVHLTIGNTFPCKFHDEFCIVF